MTQTPSDVRRLLDRHGLQPRKRLGQHFLADPNIVERIIDLADLDPQSQVLEIGAGTGTLTRALALRNHRVIAYEIDRAMEPILAETLKGVDAEVRFEDALDADFARTLEGPWTLVANLPYNVGTPILLDLIRHAPMVDRFCVMVQKEVADRLTAEPGSRTFGLPSVVAGLYTTRRGEFRVGPQVFVPPPTVGSAVVRLDRIDASPHAERCVALATTAFNQRRKMLRQSLKDVVANTSEALSAAGIDPSRRPETLTIAEWIGLGGAVS